MITIRSNFTHSQQDAIFRLIERISHFKSFSLYNGYLSSKSLNILEDKKLKKLKLTNTVLEKSRRYYLVEIILQNKNLEKLILLNNTCPHIDCVRIIMNEITWRLNKRSTSNIKELTFTLNQDNRIPYENLKHLKKLKKLTIYYHTKDFPNNLDKIVTATTSCRNVEVTFIEYYNVHNTTGLLHSLDLAEMLSKECLQLIKLTNKNYKIKPFDYETIRTKFLNNQQHA